MSWTTEEKFHKHPPWCSLSHHVLGLIRQVPTMTDIENQPSVFRLLCFGVRWPVENITENDERSRYYITTIENNTKLNLQRIPRCFRKLGEKFATIWNTAEWSRKTEKKNSGLLWLHLMVILMFAQWMVRKIFLTYYAIQHNWKLTNIDHGFGVKNRPINKKWRHSWRASIMGKKLMSSVDERLQSSKHAKWMDTETTWLSWKQA